MSLDRGSLKTKIIAQEGSVEHMYLDTRGYVTVGVGCLLANEESTTQLDFLYRKSGKNASHHDIVEEYRHLKKQTPGLVAHRYREHTKLVLSDETIERLLDKQLLHFENGLVREFQDFHSFPAPAQEALLDMAFNLGLGGLINKFPTLVEGVRHRRWDICARECHRRGIGDARNKETEKMFLRAAREPV